MNGGQRVATDAEVMKHLRPTGRLAQRERIMNNPRITSVGIAAALLLFSALLFGERAEAVFMEGEELLEWCEDDSVSKRRACRGYLMGISDSNQTYDGLPVVPRTFCVPEGTYDDDLVEVFIKGAKATPKKSGWNAAALVHDIFLGAYPC